MQHKVLVATKEPTGGALALPLPLLVSVSGTSGRGCAALLPQPLPGLVSNRGRQQLLPLSWERLLALGTGICCLSSLVSECCTTVPGISLSVTPS